MDVSHFNEKRQQCDSTSGKADKDIGTKLHYSSNMEDKTGKGLFQHKYGFMHV